MSLMATQSAATVSQGHVIQRTKHPHMLTNLGQVELLHRSQPKRVDDGKGYMQTSLIVN